MAEYQPRPKAVNIKTTTVTKYMHGCVDQAANIKNSAANGKPQVEPSSATTSDTESIPVSKKAAHPKWIYKNATPWHNDGRLTHTRRRTLNASASAISTENLNARYYIGTISLQQGLLYKRTLFVWEVVAKTLHRISKHVSRRLSNTLLATR